MIKGRQSGILLHLTSLPTDFGVGDLGPAARAFADWLCQAKQHYWQVLPLNPTAEIYGHSPYSSYSAFAGNTILLSPELLVADGLLERQVLEQRLHFSAAYKDQLLTQAFSSLPKKSAENKKFNEFCQRHSAWLDDFALFSVIKKIEGDKSWGWWAKELKEREPKALKEISRHHQQALLRIKFGQYLFYKQWSSLHQYCHDRGLTIIGDMPIYTCYDSADVWANSRMFKLDADLRPAFVAGVPPDYFSKTGQLWGNPVYDWNNLKADGYKWWLKRLEHKLSLIDVLRLDHFRGFAAYWEVPAGETTAINGYWVKAPADDFFTVLKKRFPNLPLMAEDLGMITDDVKTVMKKFGFPGMKILLFAFNDNDPKHPYLPQNFTPDCVVYTGTHDNNTVRGWFDNEATAEDKERLFRSLGRTVDADNVAWSLVELALGSVANTAIIPVQDLLGLGESARMNMPARTEGNWQWRLKTGALTPALADKLAELTRRTNRC
ncbi:MAG: 4-alpha-glucanotransferase [bacterium]